MIDRVVGKLDRNSVKCRWGSNGLCPACSMVRAASVARKEPERASCGTTARCGRPPEDGHHGATGRRDDRPHGERTGPALPRFDDGVRHTVLHADRWSGNSRTKGASGETFVRGRQEVDPGRRTNHRQTNSRSGQQRPSAASKLWPKAAGLQPGHPAPNTSTKSTRRALRTNSTWTPLSPRPRRWCITPWLVPSARAC